MTAPGKYRMNDETHTKLLGMLAEEELQESQSEYGRVASFLFGT
jgi:hypothetical protein